MRLYIYKSLFVRSSIDLYEIELIDHKKHDCAALDNEQAASPRIGGWEIEQKLSESIF